MVIRGVGVGGHGQQNLTHICVELAHKAGEIVVFEVTGEEVPGKLCWLPHHEAAAQDRAKRERTLQGSGTAASCGNRE
jgi:hypothetical protein